MAISTLWLIDFLRYTVDVGLLCILFSSGYRKRKDYYLKTAVTLLCIFLLCAFGSVARGQENGERMGWLYYAFLAISMLGWLLVSYQESIWDAFFALTSSMMTKQAAWKIYNVLLLLIGESDNAWLIEVFTRGRPMWYIGWYVVFLPLAAAIYFFVEKPQKRWRIAIAPQVVAIGIAIMSTNILLNGIDAMLENMGFISLVIGLYLCEALYSLLIICLKYILVSQAKAQEEAFIANELWREDRKQYEQLRESVDIIRMKCHDMRHQIYRLKGGNVNDAWINELAEHISIYDSEMQTGNEALDVILTDKQLRCQARGIALMMNVNGAALNFMKQADIYSLFGNALDNAIEYVSNLEEDKRFISLSVAPKGEMVTIHLENYFEGELEIHDGIPITQKSDKENHGIGMRSVKMIAHQYGGWINVFLRDNLFCLDVLVLHPESKEK